MALPAATRPVDHAARSTWPAMAVPLTVWAVWRVAQAVLLVAAGGHLVDATIRWDANWYLSVLDGYSLREPRYELQSNVAFFPGLPWLTTPFTWVMPDRAAAFLVANLAGLGAFVAVWGAVRAVLDERAARLAVIALALWPTSLFLAAFYTEGVFLAATAGAIWAARRDLPVVGFLAAVLAGITRSIGFALGPILAVERALRLGRVDRVAVGWAVSGPLGLGLVALVQQLTVGDALAFAKVQRAWGVEPGPPWIGAGRTVHKTMVNGLEHLHWGVALDAVAALVVFPALLVVSWQVWRRREGLGMVAWGWAAAVAPFFTTISMSYSRYVLAAWPALLVVAAGTSRWWRVLEVIAALGALAWSVQLIRMWALGAWVA